MAEIRVGRPDVRPDTPAHTPRVHAGNDPGNYEKQPGHHPDDTVDARRSTGINPRDRDPIAPVMPNWPPG